MLMEHGPTSPFYYYFSVLTVLHARDRMRLFFFSHFICVLSNACAMLKPTDTLNQRIIQCFELDDQVPTGRPGSGV